MSFNVRYELDRLQEQMEQYAKRMNGEVEKPNLPDNSKMDEISAKLDELSKKVADMNKAPAMSAQEKKAKKVEIAKMRYDERMKLFEANPDMKKLFLEE